MLKNLMASFVVLSALALSGCSTGQLKSRPISDTPWSGTALLLNYNLTSGDGSPVTDDCSLVLIAASGSGSHDVTIDLPAGVDHVLVDAPAGSFSWKSLSCSHFNRWMLDGSLQGFTAVDGRINFIGRLRARFPSKDASDQSLNAGIGAQESATQSLAIDLQSFPARWASALENPYTRKPITQAMLVPKGIYRMQVHVSQHTPHGVKAISTRSLERSLSTCDQDEQKRFPYRIGSLDDVAKYEGGKLQRVDKSGENSFSDEFLSCVDRSLRSFSPAADIQLKVTVLL